MKWVRYFYILLRSLLLIASLNATSRMVKSESSLNLIRILYRDQWDLTHYCNDTRKLEKILRDDINIELLYNGSLFKAERLSENIFDDAQIIGARSRHKLTVLCSINSWGYANKLLEEQSNRPHENESKCINEMDKFSLFVTNFVRWNRTTLSHESLDYDRWQQFNSFGRLQSGPTYNNDLLIGDYDGCQKLPSTRYCLGTYDKFRDSVPNPDQIAPFKIGLCLSRSCSPRILRKSRRLMQSLSIIVRANLPTSLIESSYELQDVHCPPLKDSQWFRGATKQDLVANILIHYVPLVWLFMLTLGTLSGLFGMEGTNFQRKYIKPFDIGANWSSFCNSDHLDPRLAGLNGAKVVCMNWLFMAHISMSINPYVKDLGQLRPYTWHGAFVLQGQHGVPLFFIISGLLAGLRYLKRRQVRLKAMLVSRYLRLVPMYLLIYAYVKKFAHLTNDGPFWDYGVSVQSEARQCINESWLVPILLLANFTPPFAHCIITGWHIANDFQIFLVLPLLFWIYRKSIWAGRTVVIAAFLVTHLSHAWFWGRSQNFTYYTASSEPALFGPRIVLDRVSLDYVNPLGRLGTYLIGVLVADLLLANGRYFNTRQTRRVTFEEKKHLTKQLEGAHGDGGELANSNSMQLDRLSNGKKQQSKGRDHHGVANFNNRGQHAPKASTADHHKSGSMNGGQESWCPSANEELGKSKYESVISTFKDTAVLLFGMNAAFGSVFTIMYPMHLKLLFEPYSKAVTYPWVRLNVELGWAICLYYLLRDNSAHNSAGQEKGRARARRVSETAADARAMTRLALAVDHDDGHKGRVLKNSHSRLAPTLSTANEQSGDELMTSGKYNLGFGGFLLKFRFWNVLVKLNYTLMLVHYSVVRYFIQSQRQLFMFTWTNFFQSATFIIFVTYVICLVIHLAIEMPLMALIKLFILKITSR